MKARLIGLALAAAVLAVVGCGDKDRGKNRDQKDRPKSTPDKTAMLRPGR